jgi:uncharacterized protein YnzC (UPF0291/DUF896 family)
MSGVNIPITGDASSLVAATNKANAALNSMGTAADNASKKITPAMGSMSSGASKAAAAMGPLGGVLSKISPQAGAAASSIAGMSSAVMGLSGAMEAAGGAAALLEVALGPIGLAMAAVTVLVAGAVAIYSELEAQSEQTAASQKVLADATDQVTAAQGRAIDGQRALRDLLGLQTEAEVDDEARSKAYAKSREADQKIALEQTRLQGLATATNAIKYKQDLLSQVDALQVQRAALAAAAIDEANAAGDAAVYAFNKKKSDEDVAARDKLAAKAKAEAAKAQSEADKRSADAARALKESVDAVANAQKGLRDITKAATEATMDEMEREESAYHDKNLAIEKNRDDALKALRAMGAAEEAYGELQRGVLDAQVAALQEHQTAVNRINKKTAKEKTDQLAKDAKEYQAYLDAKEALEKEKAQVAKEAQDQKVSDEQAVGAALLGLGNDLIAATTVQYDTTTKAGRAAAEEQFKNQKAAQMAMAIVAGALAVQQALSSAPPPANFILAGISGAAAAVEIGVIAGAQPKFHMGTTGFRPDEGTATLQRGEGVVTSQGMSRPGMREVVQAANGGRPLGGGGSINMQYQHKVYNEFIRDNLKAGSPLTRRIDSGTKVGHRQTRN